MTTEEKEMTVKQLIKKMEKNPLTINSAITLESLYKIFDNKPEKFIFHALSPSDAIPNHEKVFETSIKGLCYVVSKTKNGLLIHVYKGGLRFAKHLYYTVKTSNTNFDYVVYNLDNLNGDLLRNLL